jgi:hypothetical protein
MVDRVEHRFDTSSPRDLIGDTAYGTAAMLGWMVDDKAIEPHVPVWDRRPSVTTARSPAPTSSGTRKTDEYRLPGKGKTLRRKPCATVHERTRSGVTQADTIIYRASRDMTVRRRAR